MLKLRYRIKSLTFFILIAFGFYGIMVAPLRAELITTGQIVNQTGTSADRIKVKAFLDRADVQQQLQNMGVDAALAKARVDNLTDEEVTQLAQKIDQLPAGGDIGCVILYVVVGVICLIASFFAKLFEKTPEKTENN